MNLKNKLISHNVTIGSMMSEIANPNVVRIMKTAGFEFIIVDCEHGYFDFSQLAAMASVANGFQIDIIVRVPCISREYITKVLDMGCDGILVPMVNTAEEAQTIVNYVKYTPLGHRGISTTRPHTDYSPPPLSEYVKTANNRTIILVQIETKEAVQNAHEIALVEGIDALLIGPNDLAADMETPGQLETSEMDAAIRKVIQAAKHSNKSSGIIASNVQFLHKWQKAGMNVFSCSSEVGMLIESAKSKVKSFKLFNE